jgi:hypothetical protein
MRIRVDYYKLISEKKMGDGNSIPPSQELILIKRDDVDDMLLFETHNDDCKKVFWTNDKEVMFIDSITEDWSEEKIKQRNCYINGEFI